MHSFSGMNRRLLSRFGQSITYTPAVGPAFEITGIWDTTPGARNQNGDGTYALAGKLWVIKSDFTDLPRKNETIEIDGTAYRIGNNPADDDNGGGGIWLHLRKK